MINGVDFPEMLVVCVVVMLFFSPKDIPRLLRRFAHYVAVVRRYVILAKNRIDEMIRLDEERENGERKK